MTPAPQAVAVIGAGPIGLAAAANLLERGYVPIVFEAGASVAANFESFRQVQLFSPWRYNVDPAARRLLEASGWTMPNADELPTAGAMITVMLASGRLLEARAEVRAGLASVRTRGYAAAEAGLRSGYGSVEVLRGVLLRSGFQGIDNEWWHFDMLDRQHVRQTFTRVE